MTTLADLRKNYSLGSLDVADVDPDPIRQFQTWFAQALDAKLPEPNAMTVATVDEAGRPAARILLIKGVDQRGFVFFTNYESRKGRELAANPHAALLFYWIELERQVRIEGKVELTSAEESDAYFNSRPLGSRIGAWASDQSTVIANREALEAREREVAAQYGEAPPRPPHWGGYRLWAESVELWAEGAARIHDRARWQRSLKQTAGGTFEAVAWVATRLQP